MCVYLRCARVHMRRALRDSVCFTLFTICRAEAPGGWQNRDGGAAVKWADVVHVWVDVVVRRVKRRLCPHRGVPLGRDPDEGDVGEGRTACQRRRPAEKTQEIHEYATNWNKDIHTSPEENVCEAESWLSSNRSRPVCLQPTWNKRNQCLDPTELLCHQFCEHSTWRF